MVIFEMSKENLGMKGGGRVTIAWRFDELEETRFDIAMMIASVASKIRLIEGMRVCICRSSTDSREAVDQEDGSL